jgi:pimeloyl-ACP methyl ester carboxylesterase
MSRSMLAAAAALLIWRPARADDEGTPAETVPVPQRTILDKTLGGRQFWGTVSFFQGWRIQQHIITKHHRLLDADDFRHAAGTLAECRDKLETIRRERKLPAMTGKAVVLVHGLGRSSKSFGKTRRVLADAGYTVVPFEYPSTRADLDVAADYLRKTIDSLEGIEKIDLIVHSMGGIVVRRYLVDGADKRIGRMVMLGVPNLGADIAEKLKKNFLFKTIFGPGGRQLAVGEDVVAKLPTPDFEFGVIAGSRGKPDGYNPLIPGDDDGVVSVASTRLPGAADFLEVRCLHTILMLDRRAVEHSLRFLETGRFRADGDPQPIPKPAAE